MKYKTPKGISWEITNALPDGQKILTSDDGRYIVVNPNVDIQRFIEVDGYGDPTELDELIGGEI